jgi:hypothetical protein
VPTTLVAFGAALASSSDGVQDMLVAEVWRGVALPKAGDGVGRADVGQEEQSDQGADADHDEEGVEEGVHVSVQCSVSRIQRESTALTSMPSSAWWSRAQAIRSSRERQTVSVPATDVMVTVRLSGVSTT